MEVQYTLVFLQFKVHYIVSYFISDVIAKVNDQIVEGQCGRLFAVVYVAGLQRLVTPEDLIIVRGVFPPNIGDRLRLEKVSYYYQNTVMFSDIALILGGTRNQISNMK